MFFSAARSLAALLEAASLATQRSITAAAPWSSFSAKSSISAEAFSWNSSTFLTMTPLEASANLAKASATERLALVSNLLRLASSGLAATALVACINVFRGAANTLTLFRTAFCWILSSKVAARAVEAATALLTAAANCFMRRPRSSGLFLAVGSIAFTFSLISLIASERSAKAASLSLVFCKIPVSAAIKADSISAKLALKASRASVVSSCPFTAFIAFLLASIL
mmetsp:Transcript_27982/g.39432  ORF Transcript_27982/g.39432 Transcript_27982/m.39432 type:complete len:226 (-) Transcript_27982:810-1487(-)